MDLGHQCIDYSDQISIRVRPEHSTVVTNTNANALVRYCALEVATNYFEFIHLALHQANYETFSQRDPTRH